MVYTDSQQERTRLEQVYGDMTEGELRSMAGDASSLTSEAIQALRAEISRRGLEIPVAWQPRRKPSQTEFTTRHGIMMLGIVAGIGIALILLVLRFPQWFRGCPSDKAFVVIALKFQSNECNGDVTPISLASRAHGFASAAISGDSQ